MFWYQHQSNSKNGNIAQRASHCAILRFPTLFLKPNSSIRFLIFDMLEDLQLFNVQNISESWIQKCATTTLFGACMNITEKQTQM